MKHVSKTAKPMTLNLSEAEAKALERLATKKELTKTGVIRQALRLYQLVDESDCDIIDRKTQKRAHLVIL